jgi:hypothetical protein
MPWHIAAWTAIIRAADVTIPQPKAHTHLAGRKYFIVVRCHQQQLHDARMTLLGGQHERNPRILIAEHGK